MLSSKRRNIFLRYMSIWNISYNYSITAKLQKLSISITYLSSIHRWRILFWLFKCLISIATVPLLLWKVHISIQWIKSLLFSTMQNAHKWMRPPPSPLALHTQNICTVYIHGQIIFQYLYKTYMKKNLLKKLSTELLGQDRSLGPKL